MHRGAARSLSAWGELIVVNCIQDHVQSVRNGHDVFIGLRLYQGKTKSNARRAVHPTNQARGQERQTVHSKLFTDSDKFLQTTAVYQYLYVMSSAAPVT